ncbi:polysaccharide deacetylase family protein [Streptacidiphilus sp. PAMC 29251]
MKQPGYPVPSALPVGSSISSVRTDTRAVVLTYDDGPQPGSTDAVLNALDEHQAKATFFVLQSRVNRYRSLLGDVVAAGHEIGLHGADHRRLPDLDVRDVVSRTRDARHCLEDTLGREVTLFRPPYGEQSLDTWHAVVGLGLVPVLWSHVLRDWQDDPERHLASTALDSACPGAVLLAHDGFAGPEDGAFDGPPPRVDRGALTRSLLEMYRESGLVGCSLGQALEHGEPTLKVEITH